jgi:protease-4
LAFTLARVLALLVRLLQLVFWLALLPLWAVVRLISRVPAGTYLLVEIEGPISEATEARSRLSPPRRRTFSLRRLHEIIAEAAADPHVAGLVVVVKSFRAGFATATSLRDAFRRARDRGLRVAVHLPMGGGTKEAYAATAADHITLGPQARLAAVGLLSRTRYVRGALDRIGVTPEVHARGRFKTAAEPLERPSMSEPQREQLDALLDGLYAEVVTAVATGRRLDDPAARALIDGAPYHGQEAMAAGFVDAIAYDDEIGRRLGVEEGSPGASLRRAESYLARRTVLRPSALRPLRALAVLPVHGTIVGEASIPLPNLLVEARIIAAIRAVRTNPLFAGAVVHVDSPGGSALASERIHHELTRLAAAKPLVACMGNVAASGGYYVAVAAHEIVAQPTTVTGSIGVVAARLTLAPLFERIGIATYALRRGRNAGLLDPFLPIGPDEKLAIEREIERVYQAFLGAVAAGRGRSLEEIEPLAGGRVWLGKDAYARGLVDRLGGLEDALEVLRAHVGAGSERMRVLVVKGPRMPIHSSTVEPEPGAMRLAAATLDLVARGLGTDLSQLAFDRDNDSVVAWCPAAAALMG